MPNGCNLLGTDRGRPTMLPLSAGQMYILHIILMENSLDKDMRGHVYYQSDKFMDHDPSRPTLHAIEATHHFAHILATFRPMHGHRPTTGCM